MDTAAILALVAQVITAAVKVAPTVIQGVNDAKPFVQAIINDLILKKVISEDDRLALEAKIAELEAEALAPLPPAEPDEL